MSNEKTTEVTAGGNKRKEVKRDGNAAKGGIATIIVGTATAIAIAAKPTAKVILKIGKFIIAIKR